MNSKQKIYSADMIRTLRKRLSINRQQLADRAGVAKITVESWELGYRVPSRRSNLILALIDQEKI